MSKTSLYTKLSNIFAREMKRRCVIRKEGKCPLCGATISSFRDALSQREFEISGMCQQCQDKIFESDE